MNRKTAIFAVAGVAAVFAGGWFLRGAVAQAPGAAPVLESSKVQDAVRTQTAFASVAQVAQPAVVTITTEVNMPRRAMRSEPGPPGPGEMNPFEEFFRQFRGFGFEPGSTSRSGKDPALWPVQDRPGGGLGSGFLYRADGHIITNAHVVSGANSVTVRLSDGREFKNAKVLGSDERSDVAVVKIDASNLPVLRLGNSSDVQVGDWAIAVGNPFGLEHTLTVGVISATAREVPLTVSGPGDYLQTDASINPGNSGGPLMDIQGRVIGVNNAIYSRTGGNVGIGFAIPINTAREIADILTREGRVRRARLGVMIANIEDRAAAFGLDPNTKGVIVESVEPDSPAGRAGLQPGDVITQFNGQPVTRSVELQRMVSKAQIGSEATIEYLRNGKTQTVRPKLEELNATGEASPDQPASTEPAQRGQLGLQLGALTPELAQRYGVTGREGAIVTGVAPDSPASQAGIRPGDVILRVGQTTISNPQEVRTAVQGILERQTGDDRSVALYISRRGQRSFVIVRVPQAEQQPAPATR